jgi:hypothetical protein
MPFGAYWTGEKSEPGKEGTAADGQETGLIPEYNHTLMLTRADIVRLKPGDQGVERGSWTGATGTQPWRA